MFAPQTLQIRYGDDGVLGQAAAGIGAGQAYLRNLAMQQHQQDVQMSLMNDEANREQQMQMFNREQATRLQTAGARMNPAAQAQPAPDFYSMGTSPTSGNYFTKSSPIVQAVRTAKQQAVANAVGSAPLSDSDRTNLQTLASNDQMPFEQVRQLANDAASRAISAKNSEETDATKKSAMAATQQRFNAQKQIQGIDGQIRDAQKQSEQIQKMMALFGRDPATTPPEAFKTDPDGQAQYTQWSALQDQIKTLRSQRDSAVASSDAAPSDMTPQTQGSMSMTPTQSASPPPGMGYLPLNGDSQSGVSIAPTAQPAAVPQGKYAEGTILHSPSTGRVFRVVNGKLTEMTNARS